MDDTVFYALIVIGGLLLIGVLVVAIVLATRVWKTGKYLQAMGAGGKFAFWGALIYTVSPVDLLPDPIYLDDVGVLGAALLYLGRLAAKARERQQQGGSLLPPQLQRRPQQKTR
ncbi:YkvA family protein [Dactylosporangium sp. NPDC049525]|uniref:YkvA family protein n=1 Tax=Dactylosporangium sp. NPDC049525 TaxID=3154730 RepID=UPI00343DA1AA